MKTDMSAYGVTELTPEEKSATSARGSWLILGVVTGLEAALYTREFATFCRPAPAYPHQGV
ncbi:hypothetical protein [Bradyrhizobium sp. Cp5.3]|uniref:hypothetical protein n=1 Tax=Bradyrhizobium sp. Cp5.3 TaxID=443598 RepID=UPI0012EC9A55|nr:hypothetical protein [Bradyrhizobium sp. Cp5.3]